MNLKDYLLVEKYRPKTLDEVIGAEHMAMYVQDAKSFPHFIFYSKSPGTGKTSLAKVVVRELGCDVLMINSSNDRKLETVREDVLRFARRASSKPGVKKCVFLDEADGMLKVTQDALRNIMESYAGTTFFILTCNHIEKLTEAIKSRCILVNLSMPPIDKILERLERICKAENISYTETEIQAVIRSKYPNIRDMVKTLHECKIRKTTLQEEIIVGDKTYLTLWRHIAKGKFNEVKKLLLSGAIAPQGFTDWMFTRLISDTEDSTVRRKFAKILAEAEKAFVAGANPDIILLDAVLDMMEVLKCQAN